MKLTIRRTKGDPRDVQLIREAVPFILSRLLKPLHMKGVTLHITLTTLKRDFGDISVSEAPKFRLRLHHEMDTLFMIVTLAHELVHMAQVMDGRLSFKKINNLAVWHWMGEPYGAEPYADPDANLPWETDAVLLESDLACQFFEWYVTSLNAS